jgi:5-hydroxyisourate hydrolase-like protein (transthyretin family)
VRFFRQWLAVALGFASHALALGVSGHVVNFASNEPVADATVKLACLTENVTTNMTRPPPCEEKTVKTGSDGAFQILVYYQARYRLTASGVAGLVATRYSQTELIIDFRHSVGDITLKLSPEASITGKVFDENGQPKSGVAVDALRLSISGSTADLRSISKALTNADGVYTIRGLVSGNYYVATALQHEDKNDSLHPYLFYAPRATGLDQATLTHVDTGQNYSGVEIHLRPVAYFKLQGRTQMETTNSIAGDPPQLHLDARDGSGVLLPARDILLNPDGSFQTEVLPGAYTFLLTGAQSTPQGKNSQKLTGPIVHLLAKQEIEVTAKDLLGIALMIPPPITVNGHAVLQGTTETNITNGKLSAKPLDAYATGGLQNADIQPDGTFTLTNCDPANYALRVFPPAGAYVKAVLFNQQDITNAPMDLSRGSGGELTIIMRSAPASISGTISGTPSTSFDVVLIPETWVPNGLSPLRHVFSRNGQFATGNLPPGHYSVVATTGVEASLWEIAAFVHDMAARGAAVDVAENDQKQIAAPYVTFEEIDQLRTRLGID